MPKYECHKKVWALKIAGIGRPARRGVARRTTKCDVAGVRAKHKPEVGGYYVVYEEATSRFHRPVRADIRHCEANAELCGGTSATNAVLNGKT
jgi:hypothetical protein